MKRPFFPVAVAAAVIALILPYIYYNHHKEQPVMSQPQTVTVSSPAFAANADIPDKYGCKGENVNPPLIISNLPAGTKNVALIMHDPDAPGGDWVHWVVWNINPSTTEMAEDSVPAGAVQGKTSFGNAQYGGPCPPSGTHHYVFDVYALSDAVDLPAGSSREELVKAMDGHLAGKGSLTGLYSH
jgi:Raf kinase inhibitor-like YbhB/YbcL family protein